jgi:hypothetical protein
MAGTEPGKNQQHSVLVGTLAELARWARSVVVLETGCTLSVAWSDTRRGPVAAVVAIQASPTFARPRVERARRLSTRVCELLTTTGTSVSRLTSRTGVRAADVLALLWRLERSQPRVIQPARERKAEAAALERAAQIVERYRDALASRTPWLWVRAERPGESERWVPGYYLYPSAESLRWVAAQVRAMPSRPGSPADRHVLVAARALERLVQRAGGRVVAADVAAVIKAAWPSRYRPTDRTVDGVDDAEAARKLLARARAAVSDQLATRLIPTHENVPENVPATGQNRPQPTPRHPTRTKKTPR